jgi:hypothetical protein
VVHLCNQFTRTIRRPVAAGLTRSLLTVAAVVSAATVLLAADGAGLSAARQ